MTALAHPAPVDGNVVGRIRKMVRRWRGPAYDRRLFRTLGRLCPPGALVFDVGANDGRTVARLHRHLRHPRIIAFEPVRSTFAQLQQTASNYPDVECHQIGFSARAENATMYLQPKSALNSLDPNWGRAVGSETVTLDTLDHFTEQRGITHIDLLKVDTEGHDLEVMRGATALLSAQRVSIIMVEAGFGAPGAAQPSIEDFRLFFEPYDYYLHAIHNQCASRAGARCPDADPSSADTKILAYCDALFVPVRRKVPASPVERLH